jgi:uncharacterized membrane protein
MPQTRAQAEAQTQSRRVVIRSVTLAQPWQWLAAGWRDFVRCPGPGLLHGVVLAGFGALLLMVARQQFWWLAGSFSGFLLVAPVAATGLYAISRALEREGRAGLADAVRAWHVRQTHLVAFGVLLALAGTGWVLTSAALITAFAGAPVRDPLEFLRVVVLAPDSLLFEAWLALGGLLAAPVFASSVVAIPLLLDRRIGLLGAVLASWRTVLENPVPMALWAAVLMGLTLAGMATLLLGLVVVVPWLSHASWHAYRALVDASALPERN